MANQMTVKEILSHFSIEAPVGEFGNGHINTTYLVGNPPQYILQRINTEVFRKPEELMANIVGVTSHLRRKIAAAGGDPDRRTLTFLPANDGKYYFEAPDGSCYRIYRFVPGDCTDDVERSPELFAAVAKAFGEFQNLLADYPANELFETIPHFHDTTDRYRQFTEAVAKDVCGRAKDVAAEIRFVNDRRSLYASVTDEMAKGTVPLRVTHNDTKSNNVLLDKRTMTGVCVLDLDTVMPGSLLYDYGDALRFGASSGAEDETDLSKIYFDLDYFRAFTDAFLAELKETVTPMEVKLLPLSVRLMTMECGMRFLADHLNGDTYFRTHRPNHNLDRCRTQFCLVADMEKKDGEMQKIVAEICKKYNIKQ